MKGLITKERYLFWDKCKPYVILCIVMYITYAIAGGTLVFCALFSAVVSASIPIALLKNDDLSGWSEYSLTMPYTPRQLVWAKYGIGLSCLVFLVVLPTEIITAIHFFTGKAEAYDVALIPMLAIICFLLCSAVSLPPNFIFGTEKGSVVFNICAGAFCGLMIILNGFGNSVNVVKYMELRNLWLVVIPLFVISALLYYFSWMLSYYCYRRYAK